MKKKFVLVVNNFNNIIIKLNLNGQHLKNKIKSNFEIFFSIISNFSFFIRLSDEIDELKNLPVRDSDEELFELREKCERYHAELKNARIEHEAFQREIDNKHILMQKYEFEMQKQNESIAYLNNEVRLLLYTL